MHQDPLWYKDAVFYELHAKAFQDGNGDGVGDFRGLMERLDYVESLGVDCIWLLPCYPSPLRDDGYDIADYYGIHPSYGDLDDFEAFIEEAHRRGLRVVADLVLNHTSDQHPWFQRARHAPRDSLERDFYVWSDSDERYPEVRIIFTDTERSNWTWDPVAGQYFWHRFFSHQPDLNWDNPAVEQAMFEVMDFWLERGLDGFRADAVPYLIERDGTNCENLPETHAILKRLRQRIDAKYPGRILLAEANQWPDDVRPYFGDGDEFHMAFHFPLMPRIFMAVRQGNARPIVEIMQRTPEIPANCQWCMFLRNHDELTLEMVTDEERDYMYKEYAADPRMRLNLGIRRRLAPLMENDRRRIELLNSILFTMPGSPVVYYGDEIGMGDNIYLGDRDGVRTPMQWSPDRNAGFSRAEAARLYLPTIIDSEYGYGAINVEAQRKSPFSLLNWMRRLVEVRKAHRAFGRGTLRFLHPENPHILAYVREWEGDNILLVHNLSASAQAVRLDLAEFAGGRPVELLSGTEFLPVDHTPYALTLAPYGFFWFGLQRAGEARASSTGPEAAQLVSAIPREWLRAQRWFRGKGRSIEALALEDHAVLQRSPGAMSLVAVLRVRYREAGAERYLLPLVARFDEAREDADKSAAEPIAILTREGGNVRLYEGAVDAATAEFLLHRIADEQEVPGNGGRFAAHRTAAFPEDGSPRPPRIMRAEQSNTSVVFGDSLILKLLRVLEPGVNPDLEIPRFLDTHTDFALVPPLAGWIAYHPEQGEESTVAVLSRWVENRGDGWSYTLERLTRLFTEVAEDRLRDPPSPEAVTAALDDDPAAVDALGETVARLHLALASAGPDEPAFTPEPITAGEVAEWTGAAHRQLARVLGEIRTRVESIPGAFPAAVRGELAALVREEAALQLRLEPLARLGTEVLKTRIHGDLHLGQTLRSPEGVSPPWYLLDFEGEPMRPLAERRSKHTPLRDVAGMLRSFDYAVHVASLNFADAALEGWAGAWRQLVRERFLTAYLRTAAGAPFLPPEPQLGPLLGALELDKAIYELGYEVNNRPEWIWIPLRGIAALVESA